MISYLVGLLLVARIPELEWVPLLLLVLLPLCRFRRCRLPLLWGTLGAVVAALWGAENLSHRLPDRLARQDLVLSGVIDDLVERSPQRQRFTLRVGHVESTDPAYRRLRRLQLSFYDNESNLAAGDEVRLQVRLFPARGLRNPNAFDSERRFLSERIDARGYVRALYSQQPGVGWLPALRAQLAHRLQERFSPEAAGTLSALVLGAKRDIDTRQWQLMSQTGTAHLMVVSGLHIAVITGAGFVLARLLALPCILFGVGGRALRPLTLLLPLGLAFGYALLAGLGLPVQRALLMVAIFLLADWRLRVVSAWQRWRYALVGVTLLQPLAVIEPGAWLSFGAVALLIWVGAQRLAGQGVLAWCIGLWRMQWQLFVGMLPMSVLLFNQVGLLAPLVNLIALPLVSLLVLLLPILLPLALWDGGAVGALLVAGLEMGIEQYWHGLNLVRETVGLYGRVSSPSDIALLFTLVGVGWWLLPLPMAWRLPALCLFLPLLAAKPGLPSAVTFRATVFDVGQGLAVLVETSEGRLLYDTGPGFRGGGSVYPYAIAPSVQSRALERLEILVISHDDLDHRGGLEPLLAEVRVDQILAGQPERLSERAHRCIGQAVWGAVSIYFFALSGSELNDNDRSCVVLVGDSQCALLLPGDLSSAGELELLRRHGDRITAALPSGRLSWLLAGHHGSATSTSATWLAWLRPETVIISRAAFNHFGHPAAAVLERVRQHDTRLFDTASDGALQLESSAEGCATIAWRHDKKRYWTAGY